MRGLVVVLVAGCGSEPGGAPDAPAVDAAGDATRPDVAVGTCTRCPAPGAVEARGTAPTGLVEASGLVASRQFPGVLYAHNDSGDGARVFAFDDTGTAIATLTIAGATNLDWEDLAIGPCPSGSCIYVGDIGDNNLNRPIKTIYRFGEPDLIGGPADVTIADVEAFPFSYPAELHNAETLLVHPDGDVYVVTKEPAGEPSVVFAFSQPLVAGQTATLTSLATLPFPSGNQPDVSGGDIDPCGTSVLLRLGSTALFLLEPTASDFDSAFTAPARPIRELPIAAEQNGEAITWDATGAAYFTISEGASAPLHRIACP